MKPLKHILIIDENIVLRQAFSSVITTVYPNSKFYFSNSINVKSVLGDLKPDYTFLDIKKYSTIYFSDIDFLYEKYPETPVILFTGMKNIDNSNKTVQQLNCIISKTSTVTEIKNELKFIFNIQESMEPVIFDLTNSQLKIVNQLNKQPSNKQIAQQLELAENTVSVQMQRMFRKAGVNNRLALLNRCRQIGYIN